MTRTNDPLRASGPLTLTGQIDMICDRFEGVWRGGKQPRIEEFLGDETLEKGPTRLRELLVQLVMVDLEWRWKSPAVETISSKQASESTAGITEVRLPSKPRLEHYCERYPALGAADQLPDEMIVAEYQARHRWGDKPSHDEYQQRFPGKADALVVLLKQTDVAWANEAAESVVDVQSVKLALPEIGRSVITGIWICSKLRKTSAKGDSTLSSCSI